MTNEKLSKENYLLLNNYKIEQFNNEIRQKSNLAG
jgi:hypothetical protein